MRPQLTKIELVPADRMVRLGIGRNKWRWFIRVDLWWVGYRVTFEKPEAQPKWPWA